MTLSFGPTRSVPVSVNGETPSAACPRLKRPRALAFRWERGSSWRPAGEPIAAAERRRLWPGPWAGAEWHDNDLPRSRHSAGRRYQALEVSGSKAGLDRHEARSQVGHCRSVAVGLNLGVRVAHRVERVKLGRVIGPRRQGVGR